ncbi:MAG TPA: TIGR03826 family flagellar region protein [Bacilli bacterium]|nr:TIGR03826 family flagellar region protein [Bacilli bacterium]
MGLANCKHCGRLYNQNSFHDICNACVKEEEQMFFDVRDYLKENRRATINEVHEATEVPISTIMKFLRDGRLSVLENHNLKFPCDSCGEPISEGRYCRSCKDRLTSQLSTTKAALETSPQGNERGQGYLHNRKR